jgi:hypothetical protein
MNRTHRTLAGGWAACLDEACPLLYHFDLPVAEAQQIPEHIFEQLAEVIDPPQQILLNGGRVWRDANDSQHRDYDLPAIIWPNGIRYWYQHGNQHRDQDRPALTTVDGTKVWAQHGYITRANNLPAAVYANGCMEWWKDDRVIRRKGGERPKDLYPLRIQRWDKIISLSR